MFALVILFLLSKGSVKSVSLKCKKVISHPVDMRSVYLFVDTGTFPLPFTPAVMMNHHHMD
jgi:hypothetical protein